jgi:hypothetical protein
LSIIFGLQARELWQNLRALLQTLQKQSQTMVMIDRRNVSGTGPYSSLPATKSPFTLFHRLVTRAAFCMPFG